VRVLWKDCAVAEEGLEGANERFDHIGGHFGGGEQIANYIEMDGSGVKGKNGGGELDECHVEGIATILDIVLAHEGDKFSTTTLKVFLHLFLVSMKLEGKCIKPVNSLRTLESPNPECRRNFAKYLPVEV
jgi:hypothetical protein